MNNIVSLLVEVNKADWKKTLPATLRAKSVKIRWLLYETANNATSTRVLTFQSNLGGATIDMRNSDGKNILFAMPLDRSADVANTYTNYSDNVDDRYSSVKAFNTIEIQTYMNGILGNDSDVSSDYPITMMLDFELAK
jgi:hypothetical protein